MPIRELRPGLVALRGGGMMTGGEVPVSPYGKQVRGFSVRHWDLSMAAMTARTRSSLCLLSAEARPGPDLGGYQERLDDTHYVMRMAGRLVRQVKAWATAKRLLTPAGAAIR
jgi:hypothetical protein